MDTLQTEPLVELVLRAQTGDAQAFSELVTQFERSIYAVACRRLRNHAEAAELTQEVLLQAMRKLPQLREPERFAGWLRRITVRMAINRAVRRPQETVADPEMFGHVAGESRTPLDAVLSQEEKLQVKDGLQQLKRLDRETLVAFYFDGQSLIEMSDRFKSPVGTIKRRLHTARNRLREVMISLQPA